MRPELLGRVDGTAYFRPLAAADVRAIAAMCLRALAERLRHSTHGHLRVEWGDGVVDAAVAGR